MVVVVAGYTLAWLPMNGINLVMDLFPSVATPSYFKYVYVTCHWLAMAHTTYNPLIYAWINSRFRTAFRATLAKVKCSLRCPCPHFFPSLYSSSSASRRLCGGGQHLVGFGNLTRGGRSRGDTTLTTCGSSFSDSLTALRPSQTQQNHPNTNLPPIWT
ncbi:unnamed protein product [Allacma fusca]|uniref:G-protein coupled receptors family 1 profile domain-containing protein n=1 Tax=Allacma fusca TaxID=39272 RepID=A0A8J2PUJ6_9HEXA|nr:unnamed protein product [Allacma fusca]